jgi:NADH-quinone oxidoreductase subunit N
MTPTTLHAIFAPAAWLAAALLCLLLEAAGTPVGWRKRGARTHLPWILALAGAVVVAQAVSSWADAGTPAMSATGLVFDRWALLSSSLIAILVPLAHLAATPGLRALDEERGEMSAAFAVFGAAWSLMAVASDVIVLAAALVLGVASTSLLLAPDREGPHGIEAATKLVVGAGVVLVLLALAALFGWTACGDTNLLAIARAVASSPSLAGTAVVLIVVALALLLGVVPLHQTFVDVAQGAAPESSSLVASTTLAAAGAAVLHLVDGLPAAFAGAPLAETWALLAVLTLVGAPIAALDQSRVGRAIGYLAVLPAGTLFAVAAGAAADADVATAAWRAGASTILIGAVAVAAALLGAAAPRFDAAATWETWAGFGRNRPVVAALLLYVLGVLAGVPGTAGFDARLAIARVLVDAHLDLLAIIVVASAAVGAAPVVRFALFAFAKEPPPRVARAPDVPAIVVTFALLVGACVAVALLPSTLEQLVAAARR